MLPFNDEQIKQLVKDEYDIRHHFYLERIADIARGNPRLAIMAAEIAKEKGTLQSIDDVSTLYDEYFVSIRQDLEEIESRNLLQVAGIVTFFRAVDRSNEVMMKAIEEAFAISPEAFWEAAHRLHDLEVFDMYEDENEIVRVSDQILATYLFYLAFFKERVLNFAVLLEHFFPQLRAKLIDAINPVLSAFDSESLTALMRPQIERSWRAREEAGDEEGLLHLMEIFWFLKETDTLLYISQRISQVELELVDLTEVKLESNSNIPSPSILSILGSFAYTDDDTRRMALDLLFSYLAKRPSNVPMVFHLLTSQFGFKPHSYIQRYTVQRTVIDVLGRRVQEGNDVLFSKLFLALAEQYLSTRFSSSESTGSHALQITRFDLPLTPELLRLRETIWRLLFRVYRVPTLHNEVLVVLESYSKFNHDTSVAEIIAHDATLVLKFIESELEPSNYKHCSVVHDYLDSLDKHSITFDNKLRETFRNETFTVAGLLIDDWTDKRNLNLGYEQYQQYKKSRISAYFAHYTSDDYNGLLDHCLVIREHLDQRRVHEFRQGATEVFLALADRNPRLYVEVLEQYLERGDPLRLVSVHLVKRLALTCGVSSSYEILSRPHYPTKRDWLFSYFEFLPREEITAEHLNQLYSLYREAERSNLPYSFDFLLKYRALDELVVARVTAIIMEKVRTDNDFASAFSGLLNPFTDVNKAIADLFADHLEVLKEAYFAAIEVRENEDHEGRTLARMLDLDSSFMVEYVDHLYERDELSIRSQNDNDYSLLWMRPDYEKLMADVVKRIYKQERLRATLSSAYLRAFFRRSNEVKFVVEERQDHFLKVLIEQQHNDPDLMELVFEVVAELAPKRRRPCVATFVLHNKRFEDFERLPLEPNGWSWSGSAVPTYQGRAEYLESLVPLLNNVALLQHRHHVERRIQWLHSRIEHEKRKDFLRD